MAKRDEAKYDALMTYADAWTGMDPDVLRTPADIAVDVREWAQFMYGDPADDNY